MDDNESRFWWIIPLVIVVLVGLVIAGFATGLLQVSKEPTQREKCESANGIYLEGWSNNCVFPPKKAL